MDTLQIIILAITQGLTEFLPISSSGHLILGSRLFGYQDQGLTFDIAVHLGSLIAVIVYFRNDLKIMGHDFIRAAFRPSLQNANSRMVWMILIATLPIILIGGLFLDLVKSDLRSAMVIAITTILFGLLLLWADKSGEKQRHEQSIAWKDALIIGLFQAVAIVPGSSRSGVTITAGLMLGLTRQAAARFSFLLSIPTILLSGSLVSWRLYLNPEQMAWDSLFLGAFLSFGAAYLCIHLFLKLIERIGMLPFVLYRLLLGALIFALAV
jgi:undecaprenyl-diphosphatase